MNIAYRNPAQTGDLVLLDTPISNDVWTLLNATDFNGIRTVLSVAATNFLPTNYTISTLPDPAANLKKYAWVTDLFNSQPDYVLSDGTYWKPVRPLATNVVTNADSALTITALANAPTQILRGTLTATRAVTLSTTNAYPGARFRIKSELVLGLNSLNIVGSVTKALGLNSWMDMEYTASSGWVQTASGGLL